MSVAIHAGLTALCAFAFLWIIRKSSFFHISGIDPRGIQGLFLVKLVAGFGLWAIYTWYYPYRNTSDAFKYFDDAQVILETLKSNPKHFFQFLFGVGMDSPEIIAYFEEMHCWTSSYSYGIAHDNPTIIRVNVLIGLLSFGQYHVHTVFFAFMSFIGLTALYKSVVGSIPEKLRFGALALFICFPSILLWTSGVLKEGPLILGFGLLIYALFRMANGHRSVRNLILLAVAFLFLFTIKGYVIITALPALVSFLIYIFWLGAARKWVFPLVHLTLFIVALNAHYFFIGGDLLYVLGMKQTDFYNVARMTQAGSVIDIPRIESLGQFIVNTPGSIYRTYFRPDVRDVSGIFQLIGCMESIFTGSLIALAIIYRKRVGEISFLKVAFLLSFTLALGGLIGSVVPVLGALIRYKVPGVIALLMILFLVVDWTKLPLINREISSAHKE